MGSVGKKRWQQVSAIVSVSATGAITGFSFVPKARAAPSPSSMPLRLVALERSAQQAGGHDSALRSAVVNVAKHFLRMAADATPAEMEAIIWRHDSVNGVDHGASCAAFASLTLELGAEAVGQQSWVTGGTSYPWPLHKWADVRVDPNPSSPDIVSVLQDAQAHHRWHPLNSGYRPRPGDWVLFQGHIEVVTSYAHGTLGTIGGDSSPNLSVNAHEYHAPLSAQGVAGFVDNGALPTTNRGAPASGSTGGAGHSSAADAAAPRAASAASPGQAGSAGARPAASPAPASASAGSGIAGPAPGGPSVTAPAQPAPPEIPGPAAKLDAGRSPDTPTGGAAIPGVPAQRAHDAAPGAEPSPHPGRQAAASASRPRPSAGRRAPAVSTPSRSSRPGSPTRTPAAGASGPATRGASPRKPAPSAASPQKGPATGGARGVSGDPGPAAGDTGPAAGNTGSSSVGSPPARPARSATSRSATSRSATSRARSSAAGPGSAQIPGAGSSTPRRSPRRPARPPSSTARPRGTDAQQAFIQRVAPGAIAAQRAYGVPASVTIAQAIEESGWGRSELATKDHNLFGVKGTGPAGTDRRPTQEYENGHLVTRIASFRAYRDDAQSIEEHGRLLATNERYRSAMALRQHPNAFAAALTGIYATDPRYGAKLVALMRQFDLYRYDAAASRPAATPGPSRRAQAPRRPARGSASIPGAPAPAATAASASAHVDAPAAASSVIVTAEYRRRIPPSAQKAFAQSARAALLRTEPLYRDVAGHSGIRWELLAACDWMQCQAQRRHSPVHGERLGTPNPDGTVYRTRSEALAQCADDLVELASAVYGIDLTARRALSVRDLASVFAAFRWGGLLQRHRTSPMEFPYSVAGLTAQHTRMRWPDIAEPNAPDKPGARFRRPFGAVPVALLLDHPATVDQPAPRGAREGRQ